MGSLTQSIRMCRNNHSSGDRLEAEGAAGGAGRGIFAMSFPSSASAGSRCRLASPPMLRPTGAPGVRLLYTSRSSLCRGSDAKGKGVSSPLSGRTSIQADGTSSDASKRTPPFLGFLDTLVNPSSSLASSSTPMRWISSICCRIHPFGGAFRLRASSFF